MNRRWWRSQVGAGIAIGLVVAAGRAQATTIDFDHDAAGAPISAPGLFSWTQPLTELYAPLGVHFSGPAPQEGGAIINQSGRFGLPARSGTNFLGFNISHFGMGLIDSYPVGPETIRFDAPMSEVSVYAGSSSAATFQMEAYDAAGTLVDSASVTARDWAELAVSSPDGIQKIVLDPPGMTYWVYDDLSFTPSAPEPCPLALLGLGLGGLIYRRHPGRRRSQRRHAFQPGA